MSDDLLNRCNSICGESRDECIVSHKNHVKCIADMVTNKVFGIHSVLELASQAKEPLFAYDINLLMNSTQELMNWVQYLQLSHDLKSLRTLAAESSNPDNVRRETRYPLPPIYQNYIVTEVKLNGLLHRVFMNNFSRRGVQITSPERIEKDSLIECCLHTVHQVNKELSFNALVRYCREADEGYLIGAMIEEPRDILNFDFFMNIYNVLKELKLK